MLRQALRKLRRWNYWSDTVEDYHPVNPRPKWGYGAPPNPYLAAALERSRSNYVGVLTAMAQHAERLHAIPHDAPPSDSQLPYWTNPWFSTLDAASLVSFLWSHSPKRYVEIGSGFSTKFARYAIREGGLSTTITSIDPNPRAAIDALCDRVVREALENIDLGTFDALEAGDILFYDGSHRAFTNSDVTVFFLDVLPRLKPGVIVHIHDIFLPDDYPAAWNGRLYSEQYVLAAMLLAPQPPLVVKLPAYFVSSDPALAKTLHEIFKSRSSLPDIPLRYPNAGRTPPCSFWLETIQL